MLRIFPLGGLGEVGMNCLALEQRGDVMLVDCGVTFDNRGLGVDVVHADFRVLDDLLEELGRGYGNRSARLAGVFVTHGHEDHIGALPYLLRRHDVPVWAPKYALGLLRHRSGEHDILSHARLFEAKTRQVYEVGSFLVEPIRVTHSIADATALAITTDAGVVLHTGDFKIDPTPPDGEQFDEARLTELGDKGVALMFSDSTNIDARGPTGSERGVGEALERIVLSAESAVIVGLFASNVHRLRMLVAIARRTGRKIVPLGRSIGTHARVAESTGYLDWPADLVVSPERARALPRRQILGLATGTQAEGNAALARMARGEHAFELSPGDTVVLSSRVIPGNEPAAYALMGDLLRRGVTLETWAKDRAIHVSGHAHREEQARMLDIVRPYAFVPAHGTLHHLTRHAELARERGVAPSRVRVLENGDLAELTASGVELRSRFSVPRVHLHAGVEVPRGVLKERAALAAEGVVFVSVPMGEDGTPGEPVVITRGVFDEDAHAATLEAARREIRAALREAAGEFASRKAARSGIDASKEQSAALETAAKLAARRVIARAVGYKPTTLVTLTPFAKPAS